MGPAGPLHMIMKFLQMFEMSLSAFPILFVCGAGIAVAMSRRQQMPRAANVLLAACIARMFLAVAGARSLRMLFQEFGEFPMAMPGLPIILGTASSLLNAAVLGLFIAAAVMDRPPAGPTSSREPT